MKKFYTTVLIGGMILKITLRSQLFWDQDYMVNSYVELELITSASIWEKYQSDILNYLNDNSNIGAFLVIKVEEEYSPIEGWESVQTDIRNMNYAEYQFDETGHYLEGSGGWIHLK